MRNIYIEKRLNLREPIYLETASYGHMGRTTYTVNKTFSDINGNIVNKKVELFSWEKLDFTDILKKEFKI